MRISINQSNRLRYALDMVIANILPQGFDITDQGNSVDTLEKITTHHKETGRIKVWSGASGNTVFRSAASNHAFRAWHDYHHINKQLPFTSDGEKAVVELQLADIRESIPPSKYRDEVEQIIIALIVGEVAYESKYGIFPQDEIGFIGEYIQNKESALTGGKYHKEARS